MSVDIDKIKRKLLIKYPTFGIIIANVNFQEDFNLKTAATNGKDIFYNPEFVEKLTDNEKTFLFAHEVCHIAFEHMYREKNKDHNTWNYATDAVINALLQKDGLTLIKGGIDEPGAEKYDAEEMYEKCLKEGKKAEPQSHSLWGDKLRQKEKQESEQQTQEQNLNNDNQQEKEQQPKDFKTKGEKEVFEENKKERKKQLDNLRKQMAEEAAKEAGTDSKGQSRKLEDIGIAQPLIDWRRLLKQAVKYDEEWTRKNVRMRNGYFRHRVIEVPKPETEILLDTSGSVSEELLKNFLRECKNIISTSEVKVGCFDTQFYGFQNLRRMEDIDNLNFQGGGGTNFNVAVNAFSDRVPNKIIFTDGIAPMPDKTIRNLIWVVFGDYKIHPEGGKVINITGEQLKKLYKSQDKNMDKVRGR